MIRMHIETHRHRNASLVLTTYAHILSDTEDRTRRAIDETLKRAAKAPSADEHAG